MKKYICTLFALLLLGSCSMREIENIDELTNSSVVVLDTGELQFNLNAYISTMDECDVVTRSSYETMESTIEDGWLFIFSEDTSSDATSVGGVSYGDESKLIQKIAFNIDSNGDIVIRLQEYTSPCFMRILANVTDKTESEIALLVAEADDETQTPSTFADYKYISVSLIGYYNIAYDELFGGSDLPDPSSLRADKGGFPAASPGIVMPNGITATTVADISSSSLSLVPVGSKVTVSTSCSFELQEVYALNVAKRAMMRSTVLGDDGLSTIADMPVPTNFGGTTKTAAVVASNGSTVNTPIYIFPNEGDHPYDESNGFSGAYDMLGIQIEDKAAYPISDIPHNTNPTYIIVKGRAEGYDVDGYYKIALINSNSSYTYDVLRNGYYKVNIYDVDNAGYSTAAEAEAGPSSEISYNITIGASSDSRNIIKVSNNGLFSVELDANEIFAQGFGTDGVTADFMVKLIDNSEEENYFTSSSKATLSATDGITLITTEVAADGQESKVQFTATQSGTITLRCGDLIQEVKVNYVDLYYSMYSGALLSSDGTTLFDSSTAIEDFDSEDTKAADMLTSSGVVLSNENSYSNRECRAKVFRPSGKGIVKLYLRQASDIKLYNNGTDANAVLDSSNAINVVYKSTGEIYSNSDSSWGVATSDILDYSVVGQVSCVFTDDKMTLFAHNNSADVSNPDDYSWGSSVDIKIGALYQDQVTYRSAYIDNPETSSVVTAINLAGDSRSYTFNLKQYFLPYTTIWECPLWADLYGTNGLGYFIGGDNSRKESYYSYVYNYVSFSSRGWTASGSEPSENDSYNKSSSSSNTSKLSDAFSMYVTTNSTTNILTLQAYVSGGVTAIINRTLYSAYYKIYDVTNQVGETGTITQLYFRRDNNPM